MRPERALFYVLASITVTLVGCGSSNPTITPNIRLSPVSSPTSTPTPAAVPTASPTATPSPATPSATASASSAITSSAIIAVAAQVFPPCTQALCASQGTKYTTCDSGMTAATPIAGNVYGLCPFTARLAHQLMLDAQPTGPDLVGGGSDPAWPVESITATVSASGGVAQVTLSAGTNVFTTDLVIISSGTQLLVDDIYCGGQNPSTTDAYAPGWSARATCAS